MPLGLVELIRNVLVYSLNISTAALFVSNSLIGVYSFEIFVFIDSICCTMTRYQNLCEPLFSNSFSLL